MRRTLLLGLLVLWCSVATAQSQKTFRVEVEQHVQGTLLFMDFYIQKTQGADFALGSANFSVVVSSQNLNVPGISIEPASYGRWDMRTDPQNYLEMDVTQKFGMFSLNTKRVTSSSGTGQLVTSQRERIARIVLPITNPAGTNTVTWRIDPVDMLNFGSVSIKHLCEFVTPAPNFPLCSVPDKPNVSASGDLALCQGQTVELRSDYAGDHIWYKDGVELSGVTGNRLITGDPGTYTAVALNYSCTSAGSTPATVSIKAGPQQPVVTLNNGVLSTTATGNLQWYLDGQPISGAVGNTYVPSASGYYTVAAIGDCGQVLSDAVEFQQQTTGVGNLAELNNFTVFPNPFRGSTNVSFALNSKSNVKLEVFNLVGQLIETVVEETLAPGVHNYTLQAGKYGYAAGTYNVRLSINDQAQSIKIVEYK